MKLQTKGDHSQAYSNQTINYKGSHRTLKPSGEVFDTEAPDDGEVDLVEESCRGGGRAEVLSELLFGGAGASLVCHRKWALR